MPKYTYLSNTKIYPKILFVAAKFEFKLKDDIIFDPEHHEDMKYK